MKKLLILAFTLTFLLSACLTPQTTTADSETEQTVVDETPVVDTVMENTPTANEDHDAEVMTEDESMDDDSSEEDPSEDAEAEEPESEMTEEPTPTSEPVIEDEPTAVMVDYDFPIEPYQGFDVGAPVLTDAFLNGNPTVLNFFASGCPICVTEMDHLRETHAEFGDRVNFIAIDVGPYVGLGTNQGAIELLAEKGITFPAGNTPDIQVLREYNVLGTPTTVFFNSDGSISELYTGLLSYDQFVTFISILN